MSDKIEYEIAKEYLNKLLDKDRESLWKSILQGVQERKKSRKEIEKDYSNYLSKSKLFQDFKNKYGIK